MKSLLLVWICPIVVLASSVSAPWPPAQFQSNCPQKLSFYPREDGNFIHQLEAGMATGRVARFESGQAKSVVQFESQLVAGGAQMITLADPTPEDIQELTQRGYVYGPFMIHWQKPLHPHPKKRVEVPTGEGETAASQWYEQAAVEWNGVPNEHGYLENASKKAGRYRQHLKKSKNYQATVEVITEENYGDWYRIFQDTILSRPGGMQTSQPNWVTETKAEELAKFRMVAIRDEGRFIGGSILSLIDDKKQLKIHRVATSREGNYPKHQLGLRAFDTAFHWALSQGERFETISYGFDPCAPFGDGTGLGLLQFKLLLGFRPTLMGDSGYPQAVDKQMSRKQLTKIFDHTFNWADQKVPPGYLIFGFDGEVPTEPGSPLKLAIDFYHPEGVTNFSLPTGASLRNDVTFEYQLRP